MNEKIEDIAFSALMRMLFNAERDDQLTAILGSGDSFTAAIENEGLDLFRQELISNKVAPWAVDALVNKSHCEVIEKQIIKLFDFVDSKALLWTTNQTAKIISKAIIDYLSSGRSDLDGQVKKFLLASDEICNTVITSQGYDTVTHPVFQDASFIYQQTKALPKNDAYLSIIKSTNRKDPERVTGIKNILTNDGSILHYLLRNDKWFATPLGKTLGTYETKIWFSSKKSGSTSSDAAPTLDSPLLAAVIKEPGVLFRKTSDITDLDEYVNTVVDHLLKTPDIIKYTQGKFTHGTGLAVDIPDESESEPYFNVAYLLDERLFRGISLRPAYMTDYNVEFVVNNALAKSLCPVSLIGHAFGSEDGVFYKRQLTKFANSKTFDKTVLPELNRLNTNDPNELRKAYSIAKTAAVLADLWDKQTGYLIAKKAKQVFLDTLQTYLRANTESSIDMEALGDYLSAGLGHTHFKDDISRALSEHHLSTASDLAQRPETDAPTPGLY